MKLKIRPSTPTWFASDTHYDHKNICRGTSTWTDRSKLRDFDTLEEMNQALVDNINECVGPDDILFHLGDWSFNGFDNILKFRRQIKCNNIHLILGNHDHHIERNKDGIRDLFASVNHYMELEIGNLKFVLMHYPIASWNGMDKGVMHLHGHVHLPPKHRVTGGKAMDVGMEGNHLFPISLEEILRNLRNQPIANLILPTDHHNNG